MAEVTADNLIADGYREFPPSVIDHCERMFQKRFDGPDGIRFHLTFREWLIEGMVSYDARMSGETDTSGHAWITIKEPSIEATEARAEVFWQAAGSVYYEREP